jgi:hypothetical protein
VVADFDGSNSGDGSGAMKSWGIVLASAIFLGFADSTKMAGKSVGPAAEKPSKRYRDAPTQPTNKPYALKKGDLQGIN